MIFATVDSVQASPAEDVALKLQRDKRWEAASIVREWELPWVERAVIDKPQELWHR